MIEIIKAAFFAGEVKTFLMQGEYLEIIEAVYPIDVAMLDRSGVQLSVMRNAESSYFSRPGKYEVIQVTSSQAQIVRLFVGSGDAGTRRFSGQVSVLGSVSLANENATSFENSTAIAVTATETPLATARLMRRNIRFTNIGADPVALGAPGITWEKRCVILNPGDMWLEEKAANLAWAAICDTAKTASITAQEVMV